MLNALVNSEMIIQLISYLNSLDLKYKCLLGKHNIEIEKVKFQDLITKRKDCIANHPALERNSKYLDFVGVSSVYSDILSTYLVKSKS